MINNNLEVGLKKLKIDIKMSLRETSSVGRKQREMILSKNIDKKFKPFIIPVRLILIK